MRRARFLVAYDGAPFHGFAENDGVGTVLGSFREAVELVVRQPVELVGAGRTDAGVHAWGQVVSGDLPGETNLDDLARRLNKLLGPSIGVRSAEWTENDFDARFSATARHYRYHVWNDPAPNPLLAASSWHVPQPLLLPVMSAAGDVLIGEHDFSSFCRRVKVDVSEPEKSRTRKVLAIRWTEPEEHLLRLEISATAFCHQMVRSIAGTLVDVGLGRISGGDVAAILRARDRNAAGQVAPPHGLVLWRVDYDMRWKRVPPATTGGIDELDGIDPVVYSRRWKTLAVLCASLIIVIVGNTVLNVALPTLQLPRSEGGVGATNTDIQWVVDAYGLVFAGLLYTAAALGDRFGRKGALQAGLLVFGAGSMIGVFAQTSGMLTFARAVMGVGAAFVMPSTLSILANVFPARERAKAIAVWAGISGAGAAIGPVASGILLEHFWYGSVFLVNIPIIALAIAAGWVLVPKSKDTSETPLDPIGAVLSILGLSVLVYAIIEGPHHGWVSTASALWFGTAAVLLLLFGTWEWRNRHPMLDLKLFRNPRFAVSSGGITLVFFAMFGSFFMLAQYLQGVIGYSPLGAAVRMLPFSVVMMTIAPNTPKLVARLGANRVGFIGLSLVATGMLGTSFLFDVDTSYWVMLVVICILASGMAMTMTPMTTQLMAAVPRDRAGMGSATNDTTRELGGALGVAVLGSLLTGKFSEGVAPLVAGLAPDIREEAEGGLGGTFGLVSRGLIPNDLAGRLIATARQSFVDGLGLATLVAAVITVGAAFAVLRFLPSDRKSVAVTGQVEPAAVDGAVGEGLGTP